MPVTQHVKIQPFGLSTVDYYADFRPTVGEQVGETIDAFTVAALASLPSVVTGAYTDVEATVLTVAASCAVPGVFVAAGGAYVEDETNPIYPTGPNSSGYLPSTTYIPPGFPTLETVGVPAELVSSLTPYSGDYYLTTPGQIVEGLDIDGRIICQTTNAVVRQCRVTTTAPQVVRVDSGNVLSEDCRLRGVGNTCDQISTYGGYYFLRCHITGGLDGIKCGSNTTIDSCLIRNRFYRSGGHVDCAQSSGGSNITIKNSSVLGPLNFSNSAVFIQADLFPMANVSITGNYMSGGGYTLYVNDSNYGISGLCEINDNVLEENSAYHQAHQYGLRSSSAAVATWSNNRSWNPATDVYTPLAW